VRAVAAITILGLTGGFVAMLANLWVYLRDGEWQMLVVSIGIALAWILLIFAYQQARGHHFDRAGYLTLAGVMLGLGIGELVHAGLTLVLGLTGLTAIFLSGALTLSRRWRVWLLAAALYASYFWAVNRFEPLPRLDVADIASFQVAVIAIVVALLAILFWQFIRLFRFGTIRARLLATFVVLVLLPSLAIGAISNALSASRATDQVLAQLDTVAALKQAEVQGWADSLVSSLLLAMPSPDQFNATQVVLSGPDHIDSTSYQLSMGQERARLELLLVRGQAFDELFLVEPRGLIVLSTDPSHESLNEYGYPYFEAGLAGPFVSPQYLSQQLNQRIITAAAPITDSEGRVLGLLAGRVDLGRLASLLALPAGTSGLGETGETYLVARRDLRLLTASRYPNYFAGESYPLFSDGIQRAASAVNGTSSYTNYAGVQVFGAFRYLPDVDMLLLAEQTRTEALATVFQSILLNLAVTLLVILLAILGALFVTGRITTPIAALARIAERITAGELDIIDQPVGAHTVRPGDMHPDDMRSEGVRPDDNMRHGSAHPLALQQHDEIGALARSFYAMTARLRLTLQGLEAQVQARTAVLAQRTAYLQTAAEVSQAAATLLDPDALIRQVVELIRDRFHLYYVGLFLLDDSGEYAVLHAGTGEAGQEMLARQHRLQVGVGMIGWCVANQRSRIALRAELDDARLVNPFLPLTRSEAAIPLRSRGRVVGALTIQSDQPDAFDAPTVAVFETMADQIGIALDNARLFAESQSALEALSRSYGEQTRLGWSRRLVSGQPLGYLADSLGTLQPLTGSESGSAAHLHLSTPAVVNQTGGSEHYLGVPVMLRDQVIGVIQCYKPVGPPVGAHGVRPDGVPQDGPPPTPGSKWSEAEIEFVQSVANLLSLTLENARLYEDTQRRAESERLVAEISSRIRQSLDVDTVMQTALVELQRALGLKDITIRLGDSYG
jgi:GAF domain-containing protein/HAMP domain-containing protein